MGLVTSTEMFKKAYEGHYAIGAFNVNNMEIIQGITEAATMEKAPVILQVSKGARAYAKHVYLVKLVEAALLDAQESGVDLPIVLHLDHGPDFETCKACIDGGFTSVMIDGSHLALEENIKLTRQVVEYAHDHGVVVEGELGRLAGVEDDVKVGDDDALYTDPDEVEEFVKATGVDSLAIAIGTSHGASSVMPEYVQMINQYGGNIPGAQGVPEEMLRQAASMAVCKINVDSDLRLAMTGVIRKQFAEHPDQFDPRQYLKPARIALRDMVRHKIVNVMGCNGKA